MNRVLFVSPHAKPGGAERALTSVVRHLPRHGIEPIVAMLDEGPLEDWLTEAGCEFERVTRPRSARDLRGGRRAVAELRRIARARGARAVVGWKTRGQLYGGVAAALERLPMVWWRHDMPRRHLLELAATAIPAVAVVWANEPSARQQARTTPWRAVHRIPLGVPAQAIRARRGEGRSVRRALGWERHRLVGVVGRLQSTKGQDVFLHAAARIARAEPDVRFVIVGGAILGWEGSYPERVRRLAGELGLAERVRFVGHQEDVYPWIDALDAVAVPSQRETFCLALVEAMALGKPVAASACAGPSEIVEHERSGLLVPTADPRSLAGALLRILQEPGLSERLGAAAELRAGAFTEEAPAERFAAVLRPLVGRAAEPVPAKGSDRVAPSRAA